MRCQVVSAVKDLKQGQRKENLRRGTFPCLQAVEDLTEASNEVRKQGVPGSEKRESQAEGNKLGVHEQQKASRDGWSSLSLAEGQEVRLERERGLGQEEPHRSQ